MPEILASRVHIAIPEKTLFSEKEKETTASVFLKLKPGRDLSGEEVSGIVQLVAGSIEGLKAANVVVIDSSGKILHKSGDSGSTFAVSGEEYELQRNVEKKIEDSVQSMLQTFLTNSRSVVRASVELNLRKVEKVEEEYAPDKAVVSSQKKVSEKSVNGRGKPSGVPGAEAAEVAAAAKAKQRAAAPKQEEQNISETDREDDQVDYEVSKTVRKIVEPFGDIKRISLAVLVDGKYEKIKGDKGEELKYLPRSQQELGSIRALVFRAAGLSEERGDKIEVLNMPFEVEDIPEEKGLFANPDNKELALNMGRYAFYLIMALCIFLFVLKPFFRISRKKEEALSLQKVKDVYTKTAGPGPEVPAVGAPAQAQPALAEAFQDKALVGSIIREWVKESG
jgi:flagellar M-ring protein FliF